MSIVKEFLQPIIVTSINSTGNSNTLGSIITTGGNVGIGTTSPVSSLDLSSKTDALCLQKGTTAQRPATSYTGMIRYNSTFNTLEFFNGTFWNLTGSGLYTYYDGSSLTGWTSTANVSINSTTGYPSQPCIQVNGGAYTYILPANVTTLYNSTITYNMQLAGNVCSNFSFGCNSVGAGYMARIETRPGGNSGFGTTTNWTTWTIPTGPTTTYSSGVWYACKIQITSSGLCNFYINGVLLHTIQAVLNGNYIGIQGDGTTCYVDNIYIYYGII